MTEIDEHLLTAAKLMEQKRGDLDGRVDLHDHVGEVVDDRDARSLSFVEDAVRESDEIGAATFAETNLGRDVTAKFRAERADEALRTGDSQTLSHLVGVTESELQADALSLHERLQEQMDNDEAPAFISGAGNPNTGKTNLMLLLAELRKIRHDDYLVITNFASDVTDIRITSCHDLTVTLLEHRDVPKFVAVDEASTHFDARTFRREVAAQWTPLAKRFAKLGVDAAGVIVHSGKDLHPEAKRLTDMAFFKLEKEVVEFYEEWDGEEDFPDGKLFGGALEDLEKAASEYDPDDSAPWSWDLRPELFSEDLSWSELLDELKRTGPVSE